MIITFYWNVNPFNNFVFKDVNAGKNAHLKFLEELTKEEQKEFAGLVDKNEDLFKENNKLKGEIKSYKTDLETIKAKNEESDKKMAEIIVRFIGFK